MIRNWKVLPWKIGLERKRWMRSFRKSFQSHNFHKRAHLIWWRPHPTSLSPTYSPSTHSPTCPQISFCCGCSLGHQSCPEIINKKGKKAAPVVDSVHKSTGSSYNPRAPPRSRMMNELALYSAYLCPPSTRGPKKWVAGGQAAGEDQRWKNPSC